MKKREKERHGKGEGRGEVSGQIKNPCQGWGQWDGESLHPIVSFSSINVKYIKEASAEDRALQKNGLKYVLTIRTESTKRALRNAYRTETISEAYRAAGSDDVSKHTKTSLQIPN